MVKILDEANAPEYTRMKAVLDVVQKTSHYFFYDEVGDEKFQTLKDVLQEGGGDCDSMERISHHLLLQAGFNEGQLRRGIIFRNNAEIENNTLAGHMVTFVFEKGSNDPWVIDPTGAATHEVIKMSALKDWYVDGTADAKNIYKVEKGRSISII